MEPSDLDPTLNDQGKAIQQFFILLGEALAKWTRLEYQGPTTFSEGPALLVANHGFGGVWDVNALTIANLLNRLRPSPDTQITILMHQLAWTAGVGQLMEPAGFRPASRTVALESLAAGHFVLVMPGGDLEAFKSFPHRNEIIFSGRTGFASIAREANVPIVPIVVSGAGETAFVLSDGQSLARFLGLPRLLRLKGIPFNFSLPYGFNLGMAGMLPYLPFPAKMRAAILDPIDSAAANSDEELAEQVAATMSAALHEMTDNRVPFLGMRWDDLPFRGPKKGNGHTK